jgi:hypothetical protein
LENAISASDADAIGFSIDIVKFSSWSRRHCSHRGAMGRGTRFANASISGCTLGEL